MTSQKSFLSFSSISIFRLRGSATRLLHRKVMRQYEICGCPAGNQKPWSYSALCKINGCLLHIPLSPRHKWKPELKKDASLSFAGPLKIPHRLRLCIIKVLLPAQTKAKSCYHTWIPVLWVNITHMQAMLIMGVIDDHLLSKKSKTSDLLFNWGCIKFTQFSPVFIDRCVFFTTRPE